MGVDGHWKLDGTESKASHCCDHSSPAAGWGTQTYLDSFRPLPPLISLISATISQSQLMLNGYSDTPGVLEAFRLRTVKMCIWRSGATATSRWPNKLDNLISATTYSRLTAFLPWWLLAVENTRWRTLLNSNSTRCWVNVKDDVLLEVIDHFRNFQGRYTSNKDKEIAKHSIFSEERSIRGCIEELMAERNSQWETVKNTKADRESQHKETTW